MKNWLSRLFGGATAQVEPEPAALPAASTQDTLAVPGQPPSGADIDAAFFRWLAGTPDSAPQQRIETLILDELARLAASPDAGANLVPRVPAVIPQLLRSLRDDSVTGADLARQLAQDVVLVAEVIREANSPYYRPSAPVKTIEGAVMLLGQNGMRMLLARVSFRPIITMQSGQFARQLAPQIWRQSELCALAASVLAPKLGANPFEAYLAGLMENVGMMVALRLIDQMHSDAALPQSDQFCAALYARARELSSKIAAIWDFPATVTAAIADSGGQARTPVAVTLAQSDRISKLRMLVDGGQLDADDPFVTASLGDEAARMCFYKLKIEED